MSVAGVMYVYGGALIGAAALGLDHGVPMPGPQPLVPLSAALGGVMFVVAALCTLPGHHAPKKGEPGFVRRAAAGYSGTMRAFAAALTRRLTRAQVHGIGAHWPAAAACVCGCAVHCRRLRCNCARGTLCALRALVLRR
jgi:hypothetical protein